MKTKAKNKTNIFLGYFLYVVAKAIYLIFTRFA